MSGSTKGSARWPPGSPHSRPAASTEAAADRDRREAATTALFARMGELQAEREAALTGLLARLAPLEARLADMEGAAAEGAAARASLAPLAAEIAALRAGQAAGEAAARDAIAGLEARLAALSETQATALARTEAAALAASETARGEIRGVDARLAEVAATLAGLDRQQAAAGEAVAARLGSLDAGFARLEARIAELDPRGALDRFAERLEGLRGRLDIMEEAAPFAEITEQLGRLYAQKDASLETVLGRLAPLEAKLAALEVEVGGSILRRRSTASPIGSSRRGPACRPRSTGCARARTPSPRSPRR
jgi:chromosome segregation ATPase